MEVVELVQAVAGVEGIIYLAKAASLVAATIDGPRYYWTKSSAEDRRVLRSLAYSFMLPTPLDVIGMTPIVLQLYRRSVERDERPRKV